MQEKDVQERNVSDTGEDRGPANISRGDIYCADLDVADPTIRSSVQMGPRPVLIIQNAIGNKFSPTVLAAKITTADKKDYPTHQHIDLTHPSKILFEQLVTIDKWRLGEKLRTLTPQEMEVANRTLMLSLGLDFFNLKSLVVENKTVTTYRDKNVRTSFTIRVETDFRYKILNIPIRDLERYGIDEGSELDDVEKLLSSIDGMRIINKYTWEG